MDHTAVMSSHALNTPAAPSDEAYAFFQRKLRYETDPSDVYRDMQQGVDTFVVLDVRSPDAYAQSHVPGALHLPHIAINAATTAAHTEADVERTVDAVANTIEALREEGLA